MTDQVINDSRLNSLMARSNITTLQQLPTGQLIANFPKAIAEGLGLKKGDQLEWMITQEGVLVRKPSKGNEGKL